MTLRDEARWLIGEIGEAKRLAKAVGKPQLANSAIEAGKIEEYDADGSLMQIVGEQHDGTHAPVTVNGPVPPEPVPPVITVGASGVEGRWSGKFAGDMLSPMDFSHVALHASRVEVFTPSNETQLATITGELGDVATKILDAGEWTFGLVAVSKAGKWSDMSETVTVDVPDFSGGTEGVLDALLGLGSAVDGKITVDIKPPTLADGEGKPADALWNELDPVTREQVAVWRWTGTVWESLPLSETIIPKVSIGQGTYGVLEGVRLAADAVDGKTITGATVQTDKEAAKGLKLDTAGMRVYGSEGGEPVTEIRADGGTVYSITNPATGEVLAALDSEGGVTGQALSIAGESRLDGSVVTGSDPLTSGHGSGDYGVTMNGRDTLGATFMKYVEEHPNVADGNAWMTVIPHGIVAHQEVSAPDQAWNAVGGIDHARIRAVVTLNAVYGRMYQITYRTPAIKETSSVGGTIGGAAIVYSNPGGSISAGATTNNALRGSRYYLRGGGGFDQAMVTVYARCPEDIPEGKIMLGPELYIYSGRAAVSSDTNDTARWSVIVADLGIRRSTYTGRDIDSNKQGTTPPPVPAPDADPVKQYTDTVDATWWQAYTSDGTKATHSTYSGSAAQGRSPYAPGNGVMRGLVGFPSQVGRLSNATVKKIEVYVYAKHWHSSAGGTACIGVHNHGGAPDTWSSSANDVKRQKLKKPEGRWITLPSSVHAGFKSGDTKGISFLPPSSSTSSEYYGLFKGNRTKLRITYTK